jgi:hypothetical protein
MPCTLMRRQLPRSSPSCTRVPGPIDPTIRALRFASARTTTQSRATELTQTARFVDRGAAFEDADRAAERADADFATTDLAADLVGGVTVAGLDATAFGRDFPFAGFGADLANAGPAGTDLAGTDPAGIALTDAAFAATGLGALSSGAIWVSAGTEGGAGDKEGGEVRGDDAGNTKSLAGRASAVSSIALESCCARTPAGSGVVLAATTAVVGFTAVAASAA